MNSPSVFALASRAGGKAKRALLRAPLIKQWEEQRYYAAVGRHSENLPWLGHELNALGWELRREAFAEVSRRGVVPSHILELASHFAQRLRASESSESCIFSPLEELMEAPAMCAWGLSDSLLDLAEWYIGLPVQYLGVAIKRERADGICSDVRQWHRDVEDRRMLKIIVYLNEVDTDTGPFEYLERLDTDLATNALGYWSGFVSDERLAEVVDPARWRTATGPVGTTILVDTCRLFHRIRPPQRADRYSMTFSYSSMLAYQKYPDAEEAQRALLRIRDQLSPRQLRAAAIA